MPIYEYECNYCKNRFEQLVLNYSNGKKSKCPKCGGEARKLISLASIVFNAPGFYITDSRTKQVGTSSKTEASPGEKEDNKKSSPPKNKDIKT